MLFPVIEISSLTYANNYVTPSWVRNAVFIYIHLKYSYFGKESGLLSDKTSSIFSLPNVEQ